MYASLRPYAQTNLTLLPFKFDGSHYRKPRRSLGPDITGLIAGAKILLELVRSSPNGFPSFRGTVAVWTALDSDFGVLEIRKKGG